MCGRGDICDNFEDFDENTKTAKEFGVFVSTVYNSENFILQKVSECFVDYGSTSCVQIGEVDQKLAI
jgi:hypothetical protein